MKTNLEKTVSAIKEMVALFKMERAVYLIITLCSVLILIFAASRMLVNEGTDPLVVFGLFGSGGGIAYSTGRLLKMWSQAMQLIQKAIEQGDGQ
ncbi:MAG: hypothetical protein ACI8P7_001373 [Candidatus Azotimanducaceae bacterium]|jgi:hypothetical protein